MKIIAFSLTGRGEYGRRYFAEALTATTDEQRIAAVRYFNRFYTQKIGVLQGGFLQSSFSLTEVRVLYELAHREQLTATQLARELALDQGYLSRILSDFAQRGLIKKTQSEKDARQQHLALTSQREKGLCPAQPTSKRRGGRHARQPLPG